jgi:hypothetical protein
MFELFVGNDLARRRVQERIEPTAGPAGEPRATRVRSALGRAGSALERPGANSARSAAFTPRASRECG